MANNPWGVAVGPLNLAANNNLPKGARDVLPDFSGDGKISFDEHLNAFNVACGILVVQHEGVAMRLFAQTLVDGAANWFYHLPHGMITTWNDIKTRFENRYRTAEDDDTLLVQLTQMKKEIHEPMREFVAKYNKLIQKIPLAKRPNDEKKKDYIS